MQDQVIRPPHHTDNGFRNPYPRFENRGLKDFLKWQRDRLNGRAPQKSKRYDFHVIENDGRNLRNNGKHFTVTWIGHSTTLIQIAGRNILTDPIFSERCSPVSWSGPKRRLPPSPRFGHLPRIDFVLLSHDHYDHLDKPTIKKLGNQPVYIAPLRVGKILQSFGIDRKRILELDGWQTVERDDLHFHCTPAQHFSGRGLHNRNGTLWCSWAVIGRRERLYFGGDSGYFPGFKEIGEKFECFDLALLPIGAYLPRWFMAPVHMEPAQSLQAFLDIRAEKMLAIHWGTFDLADEPLDEPPQLLHAAAKSLRLNPARIWIFHPGETRQLDENSS
jgi:L-ascorbate metabolism protein UlaG (beta-lactamase superfamily)